MTKDDLSNSEQLSNSNNSDQPGTLDSNSQVQQDTDTGKLKATPAKISFGSIVLSTFAAAIGVQNKKALEKDFSNSSPMPFIVAGILFTVLFMGTIIIIANIAVGD